MRSNSYTKNGRPPRSFSPRESASARLWFTAKLVFRSPGRIPGGVSIETPPGNSESHGASIWTSTSSRRLKSGSMLPRIALSMPKRTVARTGSWAKYLAFEKRTSRNAYFEPVKSRTHSTLMGFVL